MKLLLLSSVALLVVAFARSAHPAPASGTAGVDALIMGDVNCDATVDAIDALLVLRADAGLPTSANCLAETGDTNCDLSMNAVDSLRILRHDAGLSNTAPADCVPIGQELGEQETGSVGEVHLSGAQETGFNPLPTTVQFEVTGATLSSDPLDVDVSINGTSLLPGAYQVAGNTVSGIALGDGSNNLQFMAADTEGLLLSYEANLWAGSENVTIDIQDSEGTPLNGASVTARLLDDTTITATTTSAGGQAQFQNLPQRTILLSATHGADTVSETVLDLASPAGTGASTAAAAAAPMRLTNKVVSITGLVLNDIDDTRLRFLSAAGTHNYFGGKIRIHGTITLKGGPCDELTSLELEVWEGGSKVATAKLAESAKSQLLKPFPVDRTLEITESELLFELSASEAANINSTTDGNVILKARAQTAAGFETESVFGAVPKLAHYTASNRYGPRDANRGGDDWVKPSVKPVAAHYSSNTWGDFSNMNGGSYLETHKTHQTGNDIDGYFPGYNDRNAATAATIISHLNDPAYGPRISKVLVTFKRTSGNAFWNAIKDVTLADGRQARDVIRALEKHETHFHWVVPDSGGGGASAADFGWGAPAPAEVAPAAAGTDCWTGTITTTHQYAQNNNAVTADTTILTRVAFSLDSIAEFGNSTSFTFKVSAGTADWSESGTFLSCTYERFGTNPIVGTLLIVHNEVLDTWTYSGNASVSIADPAVCPSHNGGNIIDNRAWSCVNPLPPYAFNGGNSISGSCHNEEHAFNTDRVDDYQWQFHKLEQPAN